jgi:hypothetical protein
LSLSDQTFGLFVSDGLIAEGRAFQQSPHLMGDEIAASVPGRDL